jgi:hypothetical protein
MTAVLRLGVVRELSVVGKPVQFGLFACNDIPAKQPVVWYGGLCRQKPFVSDDASHVRSIPHGRVLDGNYFARMLTRPIPMTQEALDELITLPGDLFYPPSDTNNLILHTPMGYMYPRAGPFTADEVNAFHATPMGYMANSSGSTTGNNVMSHNKRMSDICDVPYLRSTTVIHTGDQILCRYGNEKSIHHGTDDFQHLIASPSPPVVVLSHD